LSEWTTPEPVITRETSINGPNGNAGNLRLLVVIASYGANHLNYLKQIIETYKRMAMNIHVVVLSETPKDLRPGFEVIQL